MQPFFRSQTVAAEDVAQHGSAIRAMRTGEVDGVLVRGVYTEADCAGICHRLEAGQHDLVRADFPPEMGGHFLGMNLNLTHPALGDYFAEADLFREDLAELFSRTADLQARVTAILSALDDGRPYRAAPGPSPALEHMFTTLRAHTPGGFIPPHFDNEQGFRQSYRHIKPLIGADLFSFVLAFSRAESGGALEVFDRLHDGQPWRMADGEHDASRLALDGVERVSFRLPPGDMILFNSGRYLHHVTPVVGAATRWTACSFMAESLDGSAVYCWG